MRLSTHKVDVKRHEGKRVTSSQINTQWGGGGGGGAGGGVGGGGGGGGGGGARFLKCSQKVEEPVSRLRASNTGETTSRNLEDVLQKTSHVLIFTGKRTDVGGYEGGNVRNCALKPG